MRTFTGLFFAGWFLVAEFVASLWCFGPRENQFLFALADVIADRWGVSSGWLLLVNVAAYMGAGFLVGAALGAWFDAKGRRPPEPAESGSRSRHPSSRRRRAPRK